MLPNPLLRYCIDLTQDVRWDRSKIMRKVRRDGFRLSMNADFGGSLRALVACHEQQHGTWFSEHLVRVFEKMVIDPDCTVSHCAFELWDATTNALLAVTAGFGVGCAFHDYSMCTLVRDSRGSGNVLTRTVGHVLRCCGYELWYWGYKNPYMGQYDGYGGRQFTRSEFWSRWESLRERPLLTEVGDFIRSGQALVLPHESSVAL
jgi:Leu/Phe-tRNA-protein transferase